ncbi:MAG: alpha/beta hydrolase [Deltaproteobacteria bacterium]|nr:alpha/beta hydrolase [Deltaproteobacteria bacterium]
MVFQPPVVVSIHGIRTHAHWQKRLGDTLGRVSIPHYTFDYGWYGLPRFLIGRSNRYIVERFYADYRTLIERRDLQIDLDSYTRRPSVIAHSFGTYIVGYCMLKHDDVKFDKVILCGSILPRDFAWATLQRRGQVNFIRNDYGMNDVWTRLARYFVPKTGSSGADGFDIFSTMITQESFDYFRHSDYFHEGHIQSRWLSFLRKPPLELAIRHGRDITSRNRYTRLFRETSALDRAYFGNRPHYLEVDPSNRLALSWVETNPDIYTLLFDNNSEQLSGYINAMPVDRELFSQIKAGLVQDNDIRPEKVLPFIPGRPVDMYLMSIVLSPAVRRARLGLFNEAFEKLINGFIDKLIRYEKNENIRVREVVAVGWTLEGRKLCELIGMKQVAQDTFTNPVYWVSTDSDELRACSPVLPSIRQLLEIYRSRE